MLVSYYHQLERVARRKNYPLLKAFLAAGVPDSTFYRAMARENQTLSFDVAKRVADVLEQLPAPVGSTGH